MTDVPGSHADRKYSHEPVFWTVTDIALRKTTLHRNKLSSGDVLMLDRFVLVILTLVLVLQDLPVEAIGNHIDRCVKIGINRLGKQILALDMKRDLGLLLKLFDPENRIDVDDLIEVTPDPVELALDVFAQRRGDVDVMPLDGEIHKCS
jgi:hypothetical protein